MTIGQSVLETRTVKIIGLALLSATLVAGCAVQSRQPRSSVDSAIELVETFVVESRTPGLAVSVGCGGSLFWSHGGGYGDLEQRVPVKPDKTRFRVGSIAKPFTAFALATLVEQNRIDLDSSVRTYVPSFPPKEYEFTIRQLAGHLAGVRHYEGDEIYLRTHFETVLAGLQIFKDDPLIEVPGERWAYTSYGYNLLSAAMEHAAGQPFLKFMDSTVFQPIGMNDTVADDLSAIIPNRARYYRFADGAYSNEPEVDNSYKWASGGFLSTTDDLVRFGLAHLHENRLLQADTIEGLLWRPMTTLDGGETGYGLGWRIVEDEEGFRWHGHGGGSIGGTSQFWLFPDSGLVLAAAANITDLDYGSFMVHLRDHFLSIPGCGG